MKKTGKIEIPVNFAFYDLTRGSFDNLISLQIQWVIMFYGGFNTDNCILYMQEFPRAINMSLLQLAGLM